MTAVVPVPAGEGMGRCDLCGNPVPTLNLIGHLAREHPDVYLPPREWADGRAVVIDETLEPGDFSAERVEELREQAIQRHSVALDLPAELLRPPPPLDPAVAFATATAGAEFRWRTVKITRFTSDQVAGGRRQIGDPLFVRIDPFVRAFECGLCQHRGFEPGMLPHLRDDHPDLFGDEVATLDLLILDQDFTEGDTE